MSDMVDALTERMTAFQHQARERGQTARHQRMRANVLERAQAPSGRRSWTIWAWPAAVAAVAVVLGLLWTLRPQPLTFEVQGSMATDATQAFFGASDDEPLALSFSDGSAVELRPRARVRVAELRDDAADLVLESGAIEVRLRESAEAWTIEAGPYRVSTLGAGLIARWDPESRTFELNVQNGQASVEGPQIDGRRESTVGEHVVLGGVAAQPESAPELVPTPVPVPEPAPELTLVEPPMVDDATPSPSTPSAPRTGRTRTPSSRHSAGKASADWRSLAGKGEHAKALAAAETAGFSALCDSLGASALLELADVARYARRSARAREALSALRRRFPGTAEAATAAFDLGRLGSRCSGSSWFRTYLEERPAGSMAEAARQRLIECTKAAAPRP